MGNVNNQFAISTFIIFLGYLVKRFNIISEKDGEALTRLVINITLPALVISSLNTLKINSSLIFLPLIALFHGLLMAGIGIFFFRKEAVETRGMLSMLIPGFNIGLFAYPFVEAILGQNAINYLVMFDIGCSVIVFGLCYLIASYFSSDNAGFDIREIVKKLFKSIPLIVYILTLLIKILGFHYPGFVINVSQIVSKANMPLSLLILGIFLNFELKGDNLRNASKVLGLRYMIGITVGLVLYFILPFEPLYRMVLLVCLIMPPALISIAYSVKCGYDSKFVGTLLNISNLISFLLMWVTFYLIKI
jgi:malate permease and related proteins